jgi:hypothetical protein
MDLEFESWNLGLEIWDLRLNECGNLSRFQYNSEWMYPKMIA